MWGQAAHTRVIVVNEQRYTSFAHPGAPNTTDCSGLPLSTRPNSAPDSMSSTTS